MKLLRTDANNIDFISLVKELDSDLAIRDGVETTFYSQYNGIDDIKYTIVLYLNNKAIGCGAIKAFDNDSMEIKRMYTLPEYRGKGVASKVLKELEIWSKEMGMSRLVLETGKRNPEAIAVYQKKGYTSIPNYAPYIGVKNSLCFEKKLL